MPALLLPAKWQVRQVRRHGKTSDFSVDFGQLGVETRFGVDLVPTQLGKLNTLFVPYSQCCFNSAISGFASLATSASDRLEFIFGMWGVSSGMGSYFCSNWEGKRPVN